MSYPCRECRRPQEHGPGHFLRQVPVVGPARVPRGHRGAACRRPSPGITRTSPNRHVQCWSRTDCEKFPEPLAMGIGFRYTHTMDIRNAPHTLLAPEAAEAEAKKLNADSDDDWTYTAVHDPTGRELSFVEIRDGDGAVVGRM